MPIYYYIAPKLKVMRVAQYETEVDALLKERVFIQVEDIVRVCPGMPMPTVYSRINKLLREGKISAIGKGKYITAPKVSHVAAVTPWMLEVNDYLVNKCVGVNLCIAQREGNLFIQVARQDKDEVIRALQEQYHKVVLKEDFQRFPVKLEEYIVLDRLVSESPMQNESGLTVPSFEKKVVDALSEGNRSLSQLAFQKAVEAYPVNIDTLLRYAARRGVREEASALVSGLDSSRLEMIAKVQKYLATIPVERAWVFGSFARGEETPGSDLDLLVDFSEASKLSLLNVIRFKLNLEQLIGREVDMVENGYLKPFAIPSAEQDKYLIYAR